MLSPCVITRNITGKKIDILLQNFNGCDYNITMAQATVVSESCFICAESFNGSVRKKVCCSACNADICRKCIKRFLAESVQEPNCMNCREVYTNKFMDANLGYVYRCSILKKIRLDVLVAREKEYMPSLMHRAQACKEIKRIGEKLSVYKNDLYAAEKDLVKLQQEKNLVDGICGEVENNSIFTQHGVEKFQELHSLYNKMHEELTDKITECRRHRELLLNNLRTQEQIYHHGGSLKNGNYKMHCIKPDCKGFLNEWYTCGLCNIKVCKDCHECMDDVDGVEHVCKQENIESVKAIATETKPCPTCYAPVYKTEGCDQMFCVQCHTAFSWNTGMIERGRIHNPHYYEWLRQKRKQMPREVGDVPCGGLPDWISIRSAIKPYGIDVMSLTYLQTVHKMTEYIQNKEIQKYPVQEGRDEYLNKIAVDYMADKLPEKQWKSKLFTAEKKKAINIEKRLVLDMILAVLIDIFRDICVATSKETIDGKVREIDQIREYFNKSVKNLSSRFDKHCVKVISDTWMEWTYQ
jgi:hypothetical protein